MTRMARRVIGMFLAAALVLAHLPLPGGTAPAGGASCCAPKACCDTSRACTHGGTCPEAGAGHPGGAGHDGSGVLLIAGGCHDQTPRVTPISFDPTLPAPAAWTLAIPSAESSASTRLDSYRSLATQPIVPPPRA
jgi:hypothetical protein